jgi:ribonuclease P/MRP protein subunit RPP1
LQGKYLSRTADVHFFDLHVQANESLVKEAERLGFSGISLTYDFENYKSDSNEFKELDENTDMILKKCLEISTKNQEELKKKVQKSRKKADLVMVRGGDLKVNRAACEYRGVDILSQPYRGRRDTGINHILARKAAENDVAIEINLSTFLKTNLRYRYRVISQFRHIMGLKRKYNFPLILTSNAITKYDLRKPQDIFAISLCFGMTSKESFEALSTIPENIFERSENRDSYVMDGVRSIELDR